MERKEIIREIIEIFKTDNDLFVETIEELDGYNGYLGDDRYYDMELLPELLYGEDIFYILNRAYFGEDADSWDEFSSFNPNREFFKFNGYGNLVSTNYKDYSVFLDEYFIEELKNNRDSIYAIDDNPKLKVLFDYLENLNE